MRPLRIERESERTKEGVERHGGRYGTGVGRWSKRAAPPSFVIPAKAGIQTMSALLGCLLDSRLRGNDENKSRRSRVPGEQ